MLEYATKGEDARSAVILLHGASGFSRFQNLYEVHADKLVDRGYRVYAVMYYSDNDRVVMTGDDKRARQRVYRERLGSWVRTTRDALDYVSARPGVDANRISVLGFSQGAYIAVGVAGTDKRVAAMVEKYGGLPSAFADKIDRFPPSLIIHGGADKVVPVTEAHALAEFLDKISAKYEMKIYPNAGHGFDDVEESEDAEDAVQRTVDFLASY